MKINKKQILILSSLILLSLTFFFPIWKIDLEAPQYPEGIGLRIWLNKITGVNEYDLDNINKLNHYIGMKVIDQESITELKIMPYIIIFFILSGLILVFLNNKLFSATWIALLIIVLLIGLYDFYLWEYDYGHNLNPDAPIKIPGMVYQPPLIGTKQLLNMKTTSLPDTGSYLIGLAVIINSILLFDKNKFISKSFSFIVVLLLFNFCQKQPEKINYNNEDCASCQMTISDNRFGAELITKKGKVLKFDSIECLVFYSENFNQDEIYSMWVTDFSNPPELINIKDAYFLRSSEIQSPMGLNICAFSNTDSLNKIKNEFNGNIFNWEELVDLVKDEWH